MIHQWNTLHQVHSSSSWTGVAMVGMSVTGCLAVVGIVAIGMFVVHQKRLREHSNASNIELDNHQLLNENQR